MFHTQNVNVLPYEVFKDLDFQNVWMNILGTWTDNRYCCKV